MLTWMDTYSQSSVHHRPLSPAMAAGSCWDQQETCQMVNRIANIQASYDHPPQSWKGALRYRPPLYSPFTHVKYGLSYLQPSTAVDTSSGLHQSLKAGYSKDKDSGQIYNQLMTETAPLYLNKFLLRDKIVYYTDPTNQHLRTCVPQLYRIGMDFLHDHHDAFDAGNLGFHKSYKKIARVWPKLGQDVQDYIGSCSSRQQNKNLTN